MGILLATAMPNRRFLLTRAGVRLALCLLAAVGACICLAQPAAVPSRWLAGVCIWFTLALCLFFLGIAPLRLLTRTFELYENGFSVHDREVPLDQLDRLRWRRRRFRVLGLLPTSLYYLELTCFCKPLNPEKHKHGRRFVYSELSFLHLFDRFEEAYEGSLPTEYLLASPPPKKRKHPAPNSEI